MRIKKLLIILLILCSVLPVAVTTGISLNYFNMKANILINEYITNSSLIQSKSINNYFEQLESNLSMVSSLRGTKELLAASNREADLSDYEQLREELNLQLDSRVRLQGSLYVNALVDFSGIVIASSDRGSIGKKAPLYEKMQSINENDVFITQILSFGDFEDGAKHFIVSVPIYEHGEYAGYVYESVNLGYFDELAKSTSEFNNCILVVLDNYGDVAATGSEYLTDNINNINAESDLTEKWNSIDFLKNPNGFIEYTLEGEKRIASYYVVSHGGWKVLSIARWSQITAPLSETVTYTLVFILELIVLAAGIYLVVTKYFSNPVQGLSDSIRRIQEGDYKTRFAYDKPNEFGEIARAFNKLIDTVVKNTEELRQSNADLETLNANIPGGVFRCTVDDDYSFTYVSDGFLKLTGYTEQEFLNAFDNKLENTVYVKDRKHVLKELKRQFERGNTVEIEYRIVCADGDIIWVLNKGQLVRDENALSLFCVVVDVTMAKLAQEELILSEERHRIIVNQTEDVIFEWNYKNDDVYYSPNWFSKFGYEQDMETENLSADLLKSGIHEDDRKAFEELMSRVSNGSAYGQTEVRIRKASGDCIWCRIRLTAILDENGYPIRAIGAITDIDKQKKETQKLLAKAQTDSLTGLYNKITTQTLIEEYINGEGKDKKCALFVIDIDNFKAINDSLGHLFGDAVLSEISSKIIKLFRSSDIVGRIGGDEFVIFLKDLHSDSLLLEKANSLIEIFRHSFMGQNKEYKVLVSIGISTYPKDGSTYVELFDKADTALYYAKSHGKDCYWVYNDEMDSDRYLNADDNAFAADFTDEGDEQSGSSEKSIKENLSEYILKILYGTSDLDAAINLVLSIAGRHFGVDRAYIFQTSEDNKYISCTFEWCNESVESLKGRLQNIPCRKMGDYESNFDSKGIFYCNDTSNLKSVIKNKIAKLDTASFLQSAIMDGKKFRGFVGFCEKSDKRLWVRDEIDTLSLISKIVGMFLLRKQEHDTAQKAGEIYDKIMSDLDSWVYLISLDTFEVIYSDKKEFELAPGIKAGDNFIDSLKMSDAFKEECRIEDLRGGNDSGTAYKYFKELDKWFKITATRIDRVNGRDAILVCFTDITRYKRN